MSSYGVRVKIAFDDGPLVVSPTWTDIVSLAGCRVKQITVDRGRPSETAKTDTGRAVVTGVDLDGLFDPTNLTSIYAGKILPRKQAMIELRNPVLDEWLPIFRGHVDDWNYTLDITRDFLHFRLDLVDGFGFLALAELQPGQAGDTVPTGSEGNVFYEDTAGTVDDRIDAILADVGWPAGLSEIFTGNVRVREKVYAPGTQALAALQDAADAEFPGVANLYMSKSGVLTFHGRFARFRPDVAEYGINERNVGDPSLTDGDATAVPVAALGFNTGAEAIINSCLAAPEQIAITDFEDQVVTDTASIAAYGLHSFPLENLQTSYDVANGLTANPAAKLFATYYVDNQATPQTRVNQMTFRSRAETAANAGPLWLQLTRVEISDLLNLTTQHPGGGGFNAEAFFVEGIHYDIKPLNNLIPDVTLTCDVSPRAYWTTSPFALRAVATAAGRAGTVSIT